MQCYRTTKGDGYGVDWRPINKPGLNHQLTSCTNTYKGVGSSRFSFFTSLVLSLTQPGAHPLITLLHFFPCILPPQIVHHEILWRIYRILGFLDRFICDGGSYWFGIWPRFGSKYKCTCPDKNPSFSFSSSSSSSFSHSHTPSPSSSSISASSRSRRLLF
ncbi:hypothetical protein FRC18_002405 [Serendipita sp. 400]|nr:hypothetical protein FRC18_002405 [Serendipita sp. 400]